ncbi:phage tail protein [Novipirellula caenicola]|uniref:Phage tail collar domain-containing protein n=1 Tax=Novipirellula caenicola TaxID=1536901 RepID=A0ABP9VNM2_9BACT
MSEPYIGQIIMFAGNFAPRGWALCDGQLLAISSNDALFSLFGTIYGGDGRTTFGLPDLRGRLAMHAGSGPGLFDRRLGAKSGSESVTLTTPQLPPHRHQWKATSAVGNAGSPSGALLAQSQSDIYIDNIDDGASQLHNAVVASKGGSQSHTNLMPFLCINFIVALVGIYPSRS